MLFHKLFLGLCITLSGFSVIHADPLKIKPKYLPVDVSFIVVDLKYHETRGAQICEIQHGAPSAFRGHTLLHAGKDLIANHLVGGLNGYFKKSWVSINSFADPSIKKLLGSNRQWSNVTTFEELEKNEEFLKFASLPVDDVNDLRSYHGFVFMSPHSKADRETFQKQYPGVVLIDNAFYNCAYNKLKMTDLLMGDPITEQHKPKWGIFNRRQENLADAILQQIDSDILVIKPKKEFLGRGVIILKKEDLQSTLEMIFGISQDINSTDPAYLYWKSNGCAEFIVEEFIEVEPVSFPNLNDNFYSPTLRLAYLLFYDKNEIEIKCLGGYYTLPIKALNEEGTLNEHYKSCIKMPFFGKVDPKLREAAEADMEPVLTIIYKKLLNID